MRFPFRKILEFYSEVSNFVWTILRHRVLVRGLNLLFASAMRNTKHGVRGPNQSGHCLSCTAMFTRTTTARLFLVLRSLAPLLFASGVLAALLLCSPRLVLVSAAARFFFSLFLLALPFLRGPAGFRFPSSLLFEMPLPLGFRD